MTAPTPSRTGDVLVVAAEALLLTVTIAAVAGFARLFSDNDWAAPLIATAIIAHLTMAACRRLRRGLVVTGLVALVVMVFQVTWTHYRGTTTALLPTGTTRDAIDVDLTTAWNLFGDVQAPTESVTGFVVLASFAIWVIAYLADWAAFRLWSPLESMLPGFATLVFIAFFGDQTNQLLFAGLYVAAVIAFQLSHHMVRQGREVRWLAGAARLGTSSLVATGAMLSAVTVLGAVTLGPALPGADKDALVDLDERNNGPSTRVVVSPIVDIRGRLVNQPDVEAFTVRSEQPSYWRLASLDNFNGQIWGADNKYGRVSGPLPDDFPSDAQTDVLTQEFTILNMGAVWLPAAFEPRAVTSATEDAISYEPVSGTLIVSTDLENSDGLTYNLVSAVPSFDPAVLTAAPTEYPQEILDRYLQLPDGFSPNATATALDVTAGAESVYEKALALQNFFRDPGRFSYNLNVGAGHSTNRIDEFLANGEGYCEQFAGTYAAMARAIGLPARVAVGFTWGELDATDPSLYHVRGEHAHAWPEVYVPGSGWVAFEPTPTRGAPNAAQWTGVGAEQADGNETVTIPTPEVTPGTGGDGPGAEIPDDIFGNDDPRTPNDPADTTATESGESVPGWLKTAGLLLLGAIGVGLAYAALIIVTKRARRQRRIAAAAGNSQRVGAIWQNAVDELEPLGLQHGSTETIDEFTKRVSARSPGVHKPLSNLSDVVTVAAYSPKELDDGAVATATRHHDAVKSAVEAEVPAGERIKHLLDPRPLVRR